VEGVVVDLVVEENPPAKAQRGALVAVVVAAEAAL